MSATAVPRIGLLGGSFDPPHRAHLALAELALTALALHRVHWLVAAAPWQKAGRVVASAEQRLAMVALLIEGHVGMQADARELQRTGQTFTIDSVLELRARKRPTQSCFSSSARTSTHVCTPGCGMKNCCAT